MTVVLNGDHPETSSDEHDPNSASAETSKPKPIPMAATPPPAGPIKIDLPSAGSVFTKLDDMDLKTYSKHVALWNQPLLSAKYLAFLILLAYYTTDGSEVPGYTFAGFMTLLFFYRLLLVTAPLLLGEYIRDEHPHLKPVGEVLFKVGSFVKTQAPLPNAKRITFFTTGVAEYIDEKLVSSMKAVQIAEHEPRMLITVALHMFGCWLFLTLFSLRFIFFATGFIWLTVPAVYARFYNQIDPVIEKVHGKIEPVMTQVQEKGKEIATIVNSKVHEAVGKARSTAETAKAKAEEVKNKVEKKVN